MTAQQLVLSTASHWTDFDRVSRKIHKLQTANMIYTLQVTNGFSFAKDVQKEVQLERSCIMDAQSLMKAGHVVS